MQVSTKLRESLKKINLDPSDAYIATDEPLAPHCTFRIGGPADLFVRPTNGSALRKVLTWARNENIPFFILGGGANILVSDRGIRGLVIDMGGLNQFDPGPVSNGGTTTDNLPAGGATDAQAVYLTIGAGLSISDASARAADARLSGLDFIYSMPGSVGGAVYMNARCYGSEIADILVSVSYLDHNLEPQTLIPDRAHFKYKDTPFQNQPWVITGATIRLVPGNPETLWSRMKELEADRRSKGHFTLPCAGSVFKNNHAFGAPSGKIIDSLGMRGFRIGNAMISHEHANIFVNMGGARASDLRALIDTVHDRVFAQYGFDLEPEVLMVGEW